MTANIVTGTNMKHLRDELLVPVRSFSEEGLVQTESLTLVEMG